jgi:hypothetical protein
VSGRPHVEVVAPHEREVLQQLDVPVHHREHDQQGNEPIEDELGEEAGQRKRRRYRGDVEDHAHATPDLLTRAGEAR